MQTMRSEVPTYSAFLDHCPPSGPQVVSRIARTHTTEVVFVPLNLSNAFGADDTMQTILDRVRNSHPELKYHAAAPIGPSPQLLPLVDRRLRAALARTHATELDGLVLAVEGTHDQRSLSLIARRTRQWSMHHKLPVVTAFATEPDQGAGAAVRTLRSQGRRHIAVGSLFLTPDESYEHERAQALAAGAIAVGAPLGCEPEVVDLVHARYCVGAMDLLDFGFVEEAIAEGLDEAV